MRKLIAILFLSALALSLCMTAFASNVILIDEPTFLTEEPVYFGDPKYGWATYPFAGTVRPFAECTHNYPQRTEYPSERKGCVVYTYKVKVCSYCGMSHDKTVYSREISHTGIRMHTGNEKFICSDCGRVWD